MTEFDNGLEKSKEQQRTFSSAQEMLQSLQQEHVKEPEGELYALCRQALSPEGKEEALKKTELALADSEMQQIAELERQSLEVSRQFNDDEIDGETFSARSSEIRQRLYGEHTKERIAECGSLLEQRRMLGEGRLFLSGQSGNEFVHKILQTAGNAEATNYHHRFISLDTLDRIEHAAGSSDDVIVARASQEVDIPAGMFVAAEGFESWNGRPEGVHKDGRASTEVIQGYADRTTPAPAVETLTGYVLPDGRIYLRVITLIEWRRHYCVAMSEYPLRAG